MRDADEPRSVLGRVFSILDCFVTGAAEQSHGSISRTTGLPAATVHRLLADLVERGAVERVGRGRYRIGMRLWRIGSQAPRSRRLRDAALPYLQDLAGVTHGVVHLAVRDEDSVLYIEKLEARPGIAVTSAVAGRLPLHATGPGKVLLAHAPADLLDRVVAAGLPAHASGTITDPAVLRAQLHDIRRTGSSISRDETTDGVSSVASPVRDAGGVVVAAISVVVPSATGNLALLVPPVRMAALATSRAVGFVDGPTRP